MKRKNKNKNRSTVANSFDRFELIFSVLVTCLIIPLIYSQFTLDPALAPRLLVLNIIVLLLFFFSIRYYYSKDKYINTGGRLVFILFLIYLAISIISLFDAINPAEGIFDIIKTFLIFLLLFYLTTIFIRNKNFIEVLTKTIVVSALIATAIGFYQYSIYATGKSEAELFTALYNVKGLMAHKNQHAIFLFLLFPFTVYGIFYLKKLWKGLSVISFLAILILIFLLQTRSVWIGTILFIVLSPVLSLLYLKNFPIFKELKKIKRIVLVIFILIISSVSIYIAQSPQVSKLVKYKFKSIYDLDSENNRGRLQIATATLDMVEDNILLGVGAGNWKINYPIYYAQFQGEEFKNWRRPHNDFIWILAEKGLLGIIAYMSIILSVLYFCFKLLKTLKEKNYLLITIFITAGLVGYLVVSNFSFPYERISHQTFIAIYIAVILALFTNMQIQEQERNKKNLKIVFSKLYFLLFIPIIFSLYYSSKLYLSEIYSRKLMNAQKQLDYRESYKNSEQAFSFLTTIDQTNNPFYFHSGFALYNLKRYNDAERDFIKAYFYHPYHHGNLYNIASSYGRKMEFEKAIYYYKKVLEVYPFYESTLRNLAKAQFESKKYKEAYTTLLKIKIRPNDNSLNELLSNTIRILNH